MVLGALFLEAGDTMQEPQGMNPQDQDCDDGISITASPAAAAGAKAATLARSNVLASASAQGQLVTVPTILESCVRKPWPASCILNAGRPFAGAPNKLPTCARINR